MKTDSTRIKVTNLQFIRAIVFAIVALFSFSVFAQSGPAVTIIAPSNGASASGKITINANVTDTGPNAVKTIQFNIG